MVPILPAVLPAARACQVLSPYIALLWALGAIHAIWGHPSPCLQPAEDSRGAKWGPPPCQFHHSWFEPSLSPPTIPWLLLARCLGPLGGPA